MSDDGGAIPHLKSFIPENDMPLTAGDFQHGVVAARPDQMYGWPGITLTADNEILVAASERIYHVSPQGRTVVMRSADGGKTWSLPQEIYNSEQDDRDVNLLTMSDGTIVLTAVSTTDWVPYVINGKFVEGTAIPEPWQTHWEAMVKRMGLTEELPLYYWLMRSPDGGRTWTGPIDTPTIQHAGPSVLDDGRLIYVMEDMAHEPAVMSVWQSTDKGDTWQQISEMPRSAEAATLGLSENHLVETSPGNLVVMFRSGSDDWNDQYLCRSQSYDAGRTWSPIHRLSVWGQPPHLTKLSSGALLCTYGHRREPLSIRAMLSYDDGQTWDHENLITLHELPVPHDFGYPVSVEPTPGRIVTVWYLNKKYVQRDGGFIHLPYVEDAGGIMSVRWTLE